MTSAPTPSRNQCGRTARLAALLLVLAFPAPRAADAQWRPPSWFEGSGPSAHVASHYAIRPASFARLSSSRAPATLGGSPPLTLAGALVGAVAGGTMGGLVGARFMGDGCQSGNPKACLGEAFPGFVWGVGIGTTLGAPLGAHLGNGRRGDLPRAVLVSSAFLAGEVVALRTFIEGDQIRPGRRRAVQAIVILTPIAQIVAAALVERQSAARR